ncbi:MAG: LLM class flavin-dependent oxidoreductase [Pseudolabrys sp.]|nr:LLM class flavin-dependent oxidoreductase [Pseudolabrys sp.]MDP2296968.1 LLM class flavin-dependent oxidoreductase [Pseudolabrys sp.]
MTALSILDLSPVAAGSTGSQALRNTLDLARLADKLGFVRYWVAEHHNMPSIASSAPDIMIGQIAAATSRMRVGSGGIMLPNHAPLMVAERFKVLEALFPGRIDLGLGRAPGTDQVTSYALRRRQGISEEDDFLDRFTELMALENRNLPDGHPFHKVRAMPDDVALPPIFLLGSSDYSAQLAGQIGAAFAFAHHFATFPADEAMRLYRDSFRPSASHARPYAILGTHVVCADTDAEADRLAATVDLNIVRRAKGEMLPLASPEDALAFDYTPVDRARIAQNRTKLSVGGPATVKAKLDSLIAATKADEVMVTTMIYDHTARKRSYELLAKLFIAPDQD